MFLLMHMGCIFMQAVMMERVFYGVPKSMGYYHDDEDDDEIDTEPPSPVFASRKLRISEVNFEIASTASSKSTNSRSKKQNDDHFKSAR